MRDDILDSFLADSCRRAHELAAASPVLKIVAQNGDPPNGYLCKFENIEHLVQLRNGHVQKSMDPLMVAIRFPSDYLRSMDKKLGLKVVGMLSPIFHPNVDPPAMCLGDEFRSGTPLDTILRMVYAVISCRNVTPDERNAFSSDACRYYRSHPEISESLRVAPLRRNRFKAKATVYDLRVE